MRTHACGNALHVEPRKQRVFEGRVQRDAMPTVSRMGRPS